jgi:nitroreductase
MEAMECLLTRRSVRSYEARPVEREKLEKIIEAGVYAPSAMGRQSAFYVAVQDAETVKRLSRMNARVMNSDTDPFYGAPAVVLAFAVPGSQNSIEDATLGLANMFNAAHALGLGSCWINRIKEMFETPEGRELLKKWGVNAPVEGVGSCILGYARGPAPAARPRRTDNVVYIG